MKKSTAKIAYMYANGDVDTPYWEKTSPPTAYLFLPRETEEMCVRLEFGLVGLVDNNYYTISTRIFHGTDEVGYPDDMAVAEKALSFFAISGEYASHSSTHERFIAKSNGYYRIEATLYECKIEHDEKPIDERDEELIDENNAVHRNDIFVAIASEWSE
ncbi:hypothetical protein [Pectobacterium carotovorum]|uniref:hypothetical protein n=1 Tax=Pectobacterium carotovorum TaxID=554 RepID=UPI003016E67D